jgi:hypothetical protein
VGFTPGDPELAAIESAGCGHTGRKARDVLEEYATNSLVDYIESSISGACLPLSHKFI